MMANLSMSQEHPFVFHLVQATLWDQTIASEGTYYPPTYEVDGFTHGSSNPQKLLTVANHFYPDVPGPLVQSSHDSGKPKSLRC